MNNQMIRIAPPCFFARDCKAFAQPGSMLCTSCGLTFPETGGGRHSQKVHKAYKQKRR